jgi:hypothetical protein
MSESLHLAQWTGPLIRAECSQAYREYLERRTQQYQRWFAAHSELKDPGHSYKAKDMATALPSGWSALGDLLPARERHLHYRSGKSSQILALGLLGAGARLDPSLDWLFRGLGPVRSPAARPPKLVFEHKLDAAVLGESPRQTSIDVFLDDPDVLLCGEAKWTEEGMGKCSCGRASPKGDPNDDDSVDEELDDEQLAKATPARAAAAGNCSAHVRDRTAYWDTLAAMAMPGRTDGKPCPLSFTYQAVRNIAAARALAKPGQQTVFLLLYDARNPYFSGHGNWCGWPAHLAATVDPLATGVRFASVSWQELTKGMRLDDATVEWAREKHGLDEAG